MKGFSSPTRVTPIKGYGHYNQLKVFLKLILLIKFIETF